MKTNRIAVAVAAVAITATAGGCSKNRPPLPTPSVMREFVVPWANAFPSDVVVDSAGHVWFTDRVAHVIGRFDPATERFDSFPIPTPKSAPYGLVGAPDGGLWFAASKAGLLGRVDPATGAIEEHPIAGAVGGPQQLVWSGGVIWFCLRESNGYGRYDVRTGESTLFSVERMKPYSVVATPDGRIWYDVLDSWYLIEVDARTNASRIHDLGEPPPPGSIFGQLVTTDSSGRSRFRAVRDSAEYAALPDSLRSRVVINRVRGQAKRMAAARDGALWLTDFRRARVVRFDPRDRTHTEYRSLSAEARPYGIAVTTQGRVWYAETGNQSIVVLDPDSGERVSIPVPTAGGTVRHIAIDERRGDVWLPLSDVGRLGLIRLR